MKESDAIKEKLALLRLSYLDKLPTEIEGIEQAAEFSEKSGQGDLKNSLKTLISLAHKLAGSGGTFGFPAISEAAKALENKCNSLLQGDSLATEPLKKSTENTINALRKAIAAAISEGASAEVGQFGETVSQEAAQIDGTDNRTVILIGCDDDLVGRLRSELAGFGFQARPVERGADDNDLELDPVPAGIVFDLDYTLDRKVPGDSLLAGVRSVLDANEVVCPLVVISADGDVPNRLQASQARATSFLVKPVLSTDLIDALDVDSAPDSDENYRILIVDDDQSTATYTKIVLNGAGMIAETENDPMNILQRLEDFSPELILMDLYMPGCNGQELASVIRQQQVFAGIPIVFLSGEDDVDKQLGAMQYGGDDFLTKPIRSSHLISAVKTRSRRFRDLRARMIRDSMTGLLNHTTTQEFLNNEINRAKREKSPLAVAALDIDHFKSVNDTYGHAVGDIVIKSLSRLLKQRLRSNDIIGRMGGEEFAAVLVGASFEKAREILEEIRIAFANIVQIGDGKEFSVTLSCGIAEYPDFATPAELLEAADRALYEAKHGGRNRVVMASP